MSLENIIEKILAEAKGEAERIVRESRDKAAAVLSAAEKEANERASAFLKEAEREATLQANQIMAQARLEKKIALLRQKRELLDEVLKRAFDQAIPDEIGLKRQVVGKEGVEEEPFDRGRLIEELRSLLEKEILETLKV